MPFFPPNIAALKEKRDLAGLLMLLKGKDARARRAAAQALGELGARSAVSAIAELLLSSDSSLAEKITAAEALGVIKDDSVVDALVRELAHSRARERGAIDAAIESPDRKSSLNFYVNRIAAGEYALRSAIAIALGRIGGARGIRALFEMLGTETGQMETSVKSGVKTSIGAALHNQGERFVPLLCEELKHKSVEVRQYAAYCLGEYPSEESVNALIAAAYDEQEDFGVRDAALRSLGNIGDRRAIPYLEDLVHSGNRAIVRGAQAALAEIRQKSPMRSDES
jgi:HEAT repeat protein